MIIKTSIGKSFGGCVKYVTGKKDMEIIHGEGVRMDSTQHMIDDFNDVRKINPDLGNAVWHTSISFPDVDAEKISNELMKDIAKDYAEKFKLEQYAIVRHNDGKHEHFHIVANRVKYDGQTVSDQYCGGRGIELSERLDKKYDLSHVQGKDLSKTNKQALHGHDKTKYEIYEAIQKELPKIKSLEELKENLEKHGITTEIHKQSTGNIYGVSFLKDKQRYKGSQIDKSCSAVNINKIIENTIKSAIEKSVPGLSQVIQVTDIIKKGLDQGQSHGHSM